MQDDETPYFGAIRGKQEIGDVFSMYFLTGNTQKI
jgi:hypothetical protein